MGRLAWFIRITVISSYSSLVFTKPPTVCDQDIIPPTLTAVQLGLDNETCYFIVKDATERCNELNGTGTVVFNVSIARSVCSQNNASLLIVHSTIEMFFIQNAFNRSSLFYDDTSMLWQDLNDQRELTLRKIDKGYPRIQGIVLGLTTHNGVPKWDDGSKLDYRPPQWIGVKSRGRFFYMEHSPYVARWVTRLDEDSVTFPLGVICQQPLRGEGVSDQGTCAFAVIIACIFVHLYRKS